MRHSLGTLLCCFLATGLLSNAEIHFPSNGAPAVNWTALDLQRDTKGYEENVDAIISRGVLRLALSLQKYFLADVPGKNVLFAPVNIGAALALILLGSSGQTFTEIANILGLAASVDIQNRSERMHQQIGRLLSKLDHISSFNVGDELKLATGIFVQNDFPIRSIFKQTGEQVYRSELLNVDFRANPQTARRVINSWVSERTGDKIKSILDDNPPEQTKVIIASALYFKAAWEKPFSEQSTRRRPFYSNGKDRPDELVMVDMMNGGGLFPYYRDRDLDCEVMGFPYKENKTTLYVVLPRDSNKEKLQILQNKLTPDDLERLVDHTRYTQSSFGFPKMTLESSLDLSDAFKQFGAKSLFNPLTANLALISPGYQPPPSASAAPINNEMFNSRLQGSNNEILLFSRFGDDEKNGNCTISDPASNTSRCMDMDSQNDNTTEPRMTRNADTIDSVRLNLPPNSNPGLYADKVLHKVYMDITESGTEAAAATVTSLARGGDITIFRVDAPFLFFIRNHETRLILFWGSVTCPTPHFSV